MVVKIRAVGYARCSTAGQVKDGETVERQVAMIQQYCELKGIELVDVIKDEGISGFKSNRPGFLKLQAMCRSKACDMVIVYDLSRLTRSLKDTLTFMDDFVQKGLVHFVSLTQDVNTTTASGKAFLAITGVFNQLYRDEISQKTRTALNFKKEKGERYSGQIPYGYEENPDGKLVVSEKDQEILRLVGQLHRQGQSLRSIARALEASGYKTKNGKTVWNAKTVSELVSRVTHAP